MAVKKELSEDKQNEIIEKLKVRFEKNMNRHKDIKWKEVKAKFDSMATADKLWSLYEMEKTGGEPDVVAYDMNSGEYIFYDCSKESPAGRRSICYDREALESRKKFKPENSALDVAAEIGIEMLNEEEYLGLQKLGNFDTKTSSWIKTPDQIRSLGGALFADFRFGKVFIYHNGAESYYAARGFRGSLRV